MRHLIAFVVCASIATPCFAEPAAAPTRAQLRTEMFNQCAQSAYLDEQIAEVNAQVTKVGRADERIHMQDMRRYGQIDRAYCETVKQYLSVTTSPAIDRMAVDCLRAYDEQQEFGRRFGLGFASYGFSSAMAFSSTMLEMPVALKRARIIATCRTTFPHLLPDNSTFEAKVSVSEDPPY
jgi:hypothetical protein